MKKVKKNGSRSKLLFVLIILVLIAFSFNFIKLASEISYKSKELNNLDSMIKQQDSEIRDDEYLLDEDHQLEYIEHIARAKYGYAAPGERAFYVSDGD